MRDLALRRRAAALAVALIAAASLAAGVLAGKPGKSASKVPSATGRPGGERRASFLSALIPPAPDAPSRRAAGVPRTVSELAARLPLERKVAQLFLVGFRGRDVNGPVFRRFGRLDLGGLVIDRLNYSDPQQLALIAGEPAVIARRAGRVPPWVLAPQQGGAFNAFPDLPPATTASQLRSAAAGGAEARQAAGTLRPLGINGVLAPDADVGSPGDPGVGARAFAADPGDVAAYVRAVVSAYRAARVFTAAEHFPGLGSALQSTDDGPAEVGLSLSELRQSDLVPFRAAVRAGVPAILVGHGLYATDEFVTPASLSRAVMQGLLRRELRFRGIAIADDLADPPITALGTVPDAAVQAVKAGADMVFISGPEGDQQASYVAVLRAARSGEIPRARIDEAVMRILSVKRDYGLIR